MEGISQIINIYVDVGQVGGKIMQEMILKMDVMGIEESFSVNELPISKVTGYINEKLPVMPYPGIKKVIFNNPATIILWNDGTRTVVKCNERDIYDPEKGFAMAISEKVLGSYSGFKREMAKWENKPCK